MKPFALAQQGWYGTHGAWTLLTFNTPGVAYSPDVKVEGSFVHRVGDVSELHYFPMFPPPPPHPETIIGPPVPGDRVLVNGRSAAPVGSQISGSHTVLYKPSFRVFFR